MLLKVKSWAQKTFDGKKVEFGRLGYDAPVAQPTTFHLKPLHIDDANYDASDDPGGDIDDPGGGSSNDWGSFSSFTTSASTLSKTPVS